MKIKLKLIGDGNSSLIQAPDYCPYKVFHSFKESSNEIYSVNSSLCNICKKCEFTDEDFSSVNQLEPSVVEKIQNYLVYNSDVTLNLSRQVSFLQKENRIPLVILLSTTLVVKMLTSIFPEDPIMYQSILSYIINSDNSLCYILGCPVYFSRKLTQSIVQVVGEVRWR